MRLLRWASSRRGLRFLLFLLAWIVTVIALFYAVENWRGGRAWTQCRQELERRGEPVEFARFIPPPAPDAENFAAIPEVRSWFESAGDSPGKGRWNDAYNRAAGMIPHSRGTYKGPRVPTDLSGWLKALDLADRGEKDAEIELGQYSAAARAQAAPGVLRHLETHAAFFKALRAAGQRPRSVYPLNYQAANPWTILLPHLANLREAALRLQLQASAELAAGQTDAALADVELILALADSLREERLLISYLVRLAVTQSALQVVWEGLLEHRWERSNLERLEAEFTRRNLMPEPEVFWAERAGGLAGIEFIQTHGDFSLINGGGDSAGPLASFVLRLVPRGWYGFEKRNYVTLFDQALGSGWDRAAQRVDPATVDENQRALESALSMSPLAKVARHRVAASVLLPALGKVILRGAVAQTLCQQAVVACAIERFRLQNGRWPHDLGELSPALLPRLPHDLITGQPMIYVPEEPDGYRLYSVGWNRKDDGGTPTHPVPTSDSPDWVWQIAPPTAAKTK